MNISFAPFRKDAVDYLSNHIGIDFHYGSFQPPNWFCVTARDDNGDLMGVIAAEFQTSFDAKLYSACTDPHCVSKRLWRSVFEALFSQAVRITAEIEPSNKRAIRQVRRMGFVYEGFCRKGINGIHDALVFGMLKDDCKFLPGYAGGTTVTMEMPYGQGSESTRPVSNG